jgi:hypothetical protein
LKLKKLRTLVHLTREALLSYDIEIPSLTGGFSVIGRSTRTGTRRRYTGSSVQCSGEISVTNRVLRVVKRYFSRTKWPTARNHRPNGLRLRVRIIMSRCDLSGFVDVFRFGQRASETGHTGFPFAPVCVTKLLNQLMMNVDGEWHKACT